MKKTLIFFALLMISWAFALPNIKQLLADESGEYVYYQDKTFSRESYIGFLIYDEKTYAVRYFSPFDEKNKKPELLVEVFWTLNPDSDFVDFTGEKILSARTPDDAEIINYIHDMFYEFSARRAKTNVSDKVVSKNDDFQQFGGNVKMVYDSLIPIFNLSEIENANDEKIFFAVTTGRLLSDDDKSFENFKGFPKIQSAKNKKAKKYSEKALDKMWEKKAENVWFCKDFAVLSVGKIKNAHETKTFREILHSRNGVYFDRTTLEMRDDFIKIYAFDDETKKISVNIMVFQKTADDELAISLNVAKDVFEKNSRYFEKCIKLQ